MVATGSDQGLAVDLQPLFQKLKPGPGLPAEQVFADQRRRLHGATVALVDREAVRRPPRPIPRSRGRRLDLNLLQALRQRRRLPRLDLRRGDGDVRATRRRPSGGESDWRDSLRATVAQLMEGLASDPRAAAWPSSTSSPRA